MPSDGQFFNYNASDVISYPSSNGTRKSSVTSEENLSTTVTRITEFNYRLSENDFVTNISNNKDALIVHQGQANIYGYHIVTQSKINLTKPSNLEASTAPLVVGVTLTFNGSTPGYSGYYNYPDDGSVNTNAYSSHLVANEIIGGDTKCVCVSIGFMTQSEFERRRMYTLKLGTIIWDGSILSNYIPDPSNTLRLDSKLIRIENLIINEDGGEPTYQDLDSLIKDLPYRYIHRRGTKGFNGKGGNVFGDLIWKYWDGNGDVLEKVPSDIDDSDNDTFGILIGQTSINESYLRIRPESDSQKVLELINNGENESINFRNTNGKKSYVRLNNSNNRLEIYSSNDSDTTDSNAIHLQSPTRIEKSLLVYSMSNSLDGYRLLNNETGLYLTKHDAGSDSNKTGIKLHDNNSIKTIEFLESDNVKSRIMHSDSNNVLAFSVQGNKSSILFANEIGIDKNTYLNEDIGIRWFNNSSPFNNGLYKDINVTNNTGSSDNSMFDDYGSFIEKDDMYLSILSDGTINPAAQIRIGKTIDYGVNGDTSRSVGVNVFTDDMRSKISVGDIYRARTDMKPGRIIIKSDILFNGSNNYSNESSNVYRPYIEFNIPDTNIPSNKKPTPAGSNIGRIIYNEIGGTGTAKNNFEFHFTNNGRFEGNLTATRVYNAVYNDYADFVKKYDNQQFEPGDIICKRKNSDCYELSNKHNKKMVVGVYSDTYGHVLGGKELPNMEDNEDNYIPIGVAGNVFVKIYGPIEEGDLIIPSEFDGVGMKSRNPISDIGTIVGKALESKTSYDITRIKMQIMLM